MDPSAPMMRTWRPGHQEHDPPARVGPSHSDVVQTPPVAQRHRSVLVDLVVAYSVPGGVNAWPEGMTLVPRRDGFGWRASTEGSMRAHGVVVGNEAVELSLELLL